MSSENIAAPDGVVKAEYEIAIEPNVTFLRGDKGDKGDKGEKGDKGDTGATGAKGDKGDAAPVDYERINAYIDSKFGIDFVAAMDGDY